MLPGRRLRRARRLRQILFDLCRAQSVASEGAAVVAGLSEGGRASGGIGSRGTARVAPLPVCRMSAFGGKAENICSPRVFRPDPERA
jgi:hypothetical protein